MSSSASKKIQDATGISGCCDSTPSPAASATATTTNATNTAANAAEGGCPVCRSLTCACGPTCQCTEEFHCSQASTVLCSLPPSTTPKRKKKKNDKGDVGVVENNASSRATAENNKKCCSSSSPADINNNINTSNGNLQQQQQEAMENGQAVMLTTDQQQQQQQQVQQTVNLVVSGMTCSMCSRAIETAIIKNIPGVVSVSVSLATDTATVVYNNNGKNDDNTTRSVETMLRDAIEAIGYTVEEVVVHHHHPVTTTSPPPSSSSSSLMQADLVVSGMTCSMCSRAIETALKNLPGVVSVSVSLATDTATVEWKNHQNQSQKIDSNQDVGDDHDDPTTTTTTTIEKIRDAIEAIGYDVEEVHVLTSPSSSSRRLPTAASSGDTGQRRPSSSSSAAAPSAALLEQQDDVETVEERWQGIMRRQEAKVAQRRRAFLWSLLGTIPILIMTMILPRLEAMLPALKDFFSFLHQDVPLWPVESWWRSATSTATNAAAAMCEQAGVITATIDCGCAPTVVVKLEDLLLFILATPVQFITGWEFYKMSYYSLFISGTFGMDVLVALGTTAAYGYAVAGTFHQHKNNDDGTDVDTMSSPHFFETSSVLISFVLAGKWMQALAVRRTSSALISLMQLQSTTAVKVTPLQQSQKTNADENGGRSSGGEEEQEKQSSKPFNPLIDPYEERLVPIPEVQTGDLVKVIRGASIPADGKVLFGEMAVDESMVTGESMPVLKTPGGVVLGGTVCVETATNQASDGGSSSSATAASTALSTGAGAAFVEVTGVGSDTALAKIIQLVGEAQTRAVPIQTFADQVAGIFVPTVCTISLLTYMCWYALCSAEVVPASWYRDLNEDPVTFSLLFGIACLVISCPCALGLATPTAVMVGTGVGAKVGVLMKGGEALEVASKVDTLLFDKTGTLTKGTPVITDYRRMDMDGSQDALATIEDNHLLWLLGSLERTSEHPLARAVVTYAEDQIDESYLTANPFVQPTSFRPLTGRGASGTVGSKRVDVGNRSFAQELRLRVPSNVEACMQELEQQGKTAILVAVDDIICLVMGIADQLKPDAASSIAYLRDVMKIDVWMVTGDNSRTAGAIARKLGLSTDRVIAEALPAAKVDQVRRLQEEDRIVAMIGDGVNDSPALAQADVGMSLGTGAEIAAEASDMVLVKGDVADVCTALHLSRAIFSRIKLNLLFSLLYNCLGIPIAAGAFYPFVKTRLPPTLAALAMGLSSISVVLSSLSLRLYRRPTITNNNDNNHGRTPSPRIAQHEGQRMTSTMNTALDNDLTMDLLSNDCLGGRKISDSTVVADNRTSKLQANRLSEIV